MRTESAPRRALQATILVLSCLLAGSGEAAGTPPNPTEAQRPLRAEETRPVLDKDYPHGSYRNECSLCHAPDRWSPATISKDFDHAASGFALSGAHGATPCTSCHATLDFRKAPSTCMSCHEDVHRGELGTACDHCHDTRSFLDRSRMQREHSTFPFPLTGAHLGLDCQRCHRSAPQGQNTYITTPTTCISCHQADYDGTKAPDHKDAGFPTECTTCHSTNGWSPTSFKHAETTFPLTGAHKTAPCSSCHGDGVYAGKSTQCMSCHTQDYNGATDPNHRTAGFPTTCATCHDTKAWVGATFNHDATAFPLTGAHKVEPCASCHADGVYKGKPAQCLSCHTKDYDGATDPNHRTAGFPTTCATCHSTQAWTGATFDHNATAFPLTGAHKVEPCASCHADGVYKGKPTACMSCHTQDYNGATDPNHRTAGFPTTCATCHSTQAWTGATFDHNATAFPLTGAHKVEPCASCHADGVYKGKPTACMSCHTQDYNGATDPNHRTAGFPTECATCHSTQAWTGATFDHNATAFPLTGAHKVEPCASCHADGVYKGKPTACMSCHTQDYNGATDPNHRTAGFPTTCATCHSTQAWTGATFDHNATAFPLTGAHKVEPCASCHADGVYKGKPTACMSCHTQDYNGATDPNHRTAGFPTECATCHSTQTWVGATFNHNATTFPLLGAHQAAACRDCHSDGVYKGKSTLCVDCHRNDYTTAAPNHVTAHFPTTCQDCHGTSVWAGARFDHGATGFPLTGAHLAAPCAGCHADGVYAGKSDKCLSCHQADYDGARDPNHRTAGFPTDCAACHATTSWAGARFDHDSQYFPIYSGRHRSEWSACSDCHTNSSSYAVFDCLGCHPHSDKTSTDSEHRGKAGYSYASTACYRCHPRGSGD